MYGDNRRPDRQTNRWIDGMIDREEGITYTLSRCREEERKDKIKGAIKQREG